MAALWRKQRMDVLSAGEARLIADAFELDYFGGEGRPPRFAVIAETTAVIEQAVRLTAVHGLQAYDAIRLAAANAAS